MPSIFNVPGVPPLSSYAAGAMSLLSGDSIASTLTQAVLQWGVFVANTAAPVILPKTSLTSPLAPFGVLSGFVNPQTIGTISAVLGVSSVVGSLGLGPIIPVIASFIEIDSKQDWPVSDYPVEQGGFQTYDKVQLPFTVRLRVAASGGPAELQTFLSVLQNMANDVFNQYTIISPSQIYDNVTCSHLDYRRSAVNGVSLLVVDLWFIQVRVTTTTLFSNTALPSFAGTQNTGIQQGAIPTNAVSQAVAAGGGVI